MLIMIVILTCGRTAVAYLAYPLVVLAGYVPDLICGVTLHDQIIPLSLHKSVLGYFKVRTPNSYKNIRYKNMLLLLFKSNTLDKYLLKIKI